jgi:hypothetical protein
VVYARTPGVRARVRGTRARAKNLELLTEVHDAQ